MKKQFLSWGILLLLFSCSKPSTTVTESPAGQIETDITAIPSEPVETPAEAFLSAELDSAINKGSDIANAWCEEYSSLAVSFYAPTDYKILEMREHEKDDGAGATIRLNSSNKGGSPIVTDWTVFVDEGISVSDPESKFCISFISEKS